MTHRFALRTNRRGLRTEITVGVDLHLNAAITEDAFGYHGHHIDAVDLRGDDERRRLVIWISGAGADRRNENAELVDDLAVPVAAGLERHQPSAMRHRPLQHDMRIDAHQLAVVIGIAVAGARRARLDVAHHWAGIAADLVVGGSGRFGQHERAHKPASNRQTAKRVTTSRVATRRYLFVYERCCAPGGNLSSGSTSETRGCRLLRQIASPACS